MFFYSELSSGLTQKLFLTSSHLLVSFINTAISSSSTSSFNISAGGLSSTVETVNLTNNTNQYSFTPSSFILSGGATQTVNVTFSPTSLGTKTGSISLSSSGGSTSSVALYGTTVEQYYYNTSLLLNSEFTSFDLSGNSFNFIDTGPNSTNLTPYGNVTRSSTQSKYGSYSMYFDGNGDYLTAPSIQDYNFATGSFTIEMWINPSISANGAQRHLFGKRTSTSNYTWMLAFLTYNSSVNKYHLNYYATINGTSWGITAATPAVITPNTWTHLAFVRNGNEFSYFINGIKTVIVNNAGGINFNSSNLSIGLNNASGQSPTSAFIGYIDEFRITKGVARYTNNFTPPGEL